ncbi:MAG: glycosyltransferase family 2 protein [Deltaproteobacteria bacterium]|nr:glycosyltransferase family 2 protein [Deltaproteobacteria bacterium]
MSNPLVCIIILNYCSLEDTLKCIETIRQIDYPTFRILAIDNASPDGGGKILQAQLPAAEFIQLPKNTGYAGGNNEGISRALQEGADYVFIVNPDVRLPPDSIRSYVDIMEADKTIGALNPIQLCHDGKTIDDKFRRGIFEAHKYSVPDLNADSPEQWEVRTLYGAALMFPAKTVKKVGGFDPLYFAYNEEEDFCRRITYRGMRLVVTAKAPVRHMRTKESEEVDDFRLFLRLKGSYLFKLKEPLRSFWRSLKIVDRDIWDGLLGRRRHKYPFDSYPIRRRHIVKSALWLVWNLQEVRKHRRMEQLGRSYV